jgi:thymidylate synthase
VTAGRLYLTYSARSQDMFSAWPQNTFAMVCLQKRAADVLGIKVGPVTCHTVSAHIYQHDWQRAEDTLAATQHIIRSIDFDPQGNFVIRVENGQIQAELHDPSGQVLWHMQGTSSAVIGKEIAALQLASLPSHYVYVGRELQRAEDSIKHGAPFDQGMA